MTRRKTKGCLIAAGISVGLIIILTSICILEAFIPENPIKLTSSTLGVKIPRGTTVILNNDEPGLPFPGGASDGYTWIILQIPSSDITKLANNLALSPDWKLLPLSEDLAAGESALQPTSMVGLEGTIPIATAEGYYFFVDRQLEYNIDHNDNTYDTSIPFYMRGSSNFTFGLFDEKTGKLYLWSIDT